MPAMAGFLQTELCRELLIIPMVLEKRETPIVFNTHKERGAASNFPLAIGRGREPDHSPQSSQSGGVDFPVLFPTSGSM